MLSHSPSDSLDQDRPFNMGAHIKLRGLTTRRKYNGLVGIVIKYDSTIYTVVTNYPSLDATLEVRHRNIVEFNWEEDAP